MLIASAISFSSLKGKSKTMLAQVTTMGVKCFSSSIGKTKTLIKLKNKLAIRVSVP